MAQKENEINMMKRTYIKGIEGKENEIQKLKQIMQNEYCKNEVCQRKVSELETEIKQVKSKSKDEIRKIQQ